MTVENADGTQSTFVLTILEKIKETRLKLSQYTQLNKLTSADKYETRKTL